MPVTLSAAVIMSAVTDSCVSSGLCQSRASQQLVLGIDFLLARQQRCADALGLLVEALQVFDLPLGSNEEGHPLVHLLRANIQHAPLSC